MNDFDDDFISAARTVQRLRGCDCNLQLDIIDQDGPRCRVAYQHEPRCHLLLIANADTN